MLVTRTCQVRDGEDRCGGSEVSSHEKGIGHRKVGLIDVTMVLGTKDTSDAALGIQRKDIHPGKTYKCWIYIAAGLPESTNEHTLPRR